MKTWKTPIMEELDFTETKSFADTYFSDINNIPITQPSLIGEIINNSGYNPHQQNQLWAIYKKQGFLRPSDLESLS